MNYARCSMLSQKHNAKYASRTGALESSTARAGTACEMIPQKTRSTSSPFSIFSLSRTFTSGKADHTVTGTGRKKVLENIILQINSERSVENEDTGERRPHPHCHIRKTQRVSWQLVDTFEFCGFRHDAHKAST